MRLFFSGVVPPSQARVKAGLMSANEKPGQVRTAELEKGEGRRGGGRRRERKRGRE